VVNGAIGDRVRVDGTPGVDVASVVGSDGPDVISAVANGSEVAVMGSTSGPFVALGATEHLDVDLRGGDDQFSATGNLAALIAIDVDGGADADTLLGGNGADVLAGGDGADFIDGQQGLDEVHGDDGSDTFQWDPGDSNDTVVGGPDADRLVFNGNSSNEIYEISAVGDHVRFFRNLAGIVLDLDEVEAIEARPAGGSDVVNVLDTTGTDLVETTTDFAGVGVSTTRLRTRSSSHPDSRSAATAQPRSSTGSVRRRGSSTVGPPTPSG
jgi:hypothetical protein